MTPRGDIAIRRSFLSLSPAWVAGLVVVSACAEPGASRAECDACRIEVTHLATLGDVDGPGALPGYAVAIARHADGSLLVGTSHGDEILIFDSAGRHLRSVGRQGEGPGEFRGGVWAILRFRGDSIITRDGRNMRLATFSPSWEPGWTAPDPSATGGGSLVALPGGGFVLGAMVRGAEHDRHPMHVLDPDGQLVRSVGGGNATEAFDGFGPMLATTDDGNVWAAQPTRYRLELWSTEDSLLRSVERDVEWFAPRDEVGGPPVPDRRPLPVIKAMHRDSSGRLWVSSMVGADDWTSGLGPREPSGSSYEVLDWELVYDTMIEVFDEATGRVLASVHLPQIVLTFIDEATAVVAFEDSLGVPRVELLRLTLEDG